MKKLHFFLLVTVILLTMFVPVTSYADLGPKPSVNIVFENIGENECYATLLSDEHSTGPYSSWKGDTLSKNLY